MRRSPASSSCRRRRQGAPRRRSRDGGVMEIEGHHARGKVGRLGRARRTRSSGSSRARISPALVRWQLPKRRPARTRRRTAPKLPHRQEDVQAEGHGRRPSRLGARAAIPRRRPCFRSDPRSHAIDLPKKVRALALRHALSAKAKDGGLIVIDTPAEGRQDQGAARAVREARPRQRADHRRRRGRSELRPRGAQHSEHRRAAGPGHQRLRHPAPPKLVLTKAAVDALEARFK